MEELEILPRDAYLHPISVTRVPCTIQWWFSTKRKNIDFGLFYRQAPASSGYSDDGASVHLAPAGTIGRASMLPAAAGSTAGTPVSTPHVASTASFRGKKNANPPMTPSQLAEPDVRTADLARSQSDLAVKQRGGYFKLQDKNVTELIPLKHYESSRSTIKGSWNAVEPGTYILYFDNSFSKNTSKRLSMCVAVKEKATEAAEDIPAVTLSGWLLKKKRKRMQGWANRWFSLQGRWLSYSTTEGGVVRSKVDIVNAVVSMSKEDRIIIVDGDEGFMQLRALGDTDFTAWVTAFQNVKDQAAQPPATISVSTDAGFDNSTQFRSSIAGEAGPPAVASGVRVDSRHLQLLQASMEDSINQLQKLATNIGSLPIAAFQNQAFMYLRLLKDNAHILIHHLSDHETAVQQQQEQLEGQDDQSQSSNFVVHRDAGSAPPAIAHVDSRMSFLSASGSDIFYDTNEVLEVAHEDLKLSPSPQLSPSDIARTVSESPAFRSPKDGKTSAIAAEGSPTSVSDGDTPTLDISTSQTSVRDDADSISDSDNDDTFYGGNANPGTTHRNNRMHRDLIRDPDFVEAFAKHRLASPRPSTSEPRPTSPLKQEHDTEYTDLDNMPEVTLDRVRNQIVSFEPRTELPAIMCEANVSLISILRKNVGKDLTSIAMPLVMNEPINALQALCEELMYSRILTRANEMDDRMDRLMHVAAFAISTLSSKKHRAERKPFNPILGETYEMVDPHTGFRFVSEKVSHHPPVMACYADSPSYRFWQDSSGKSKFWGKSMEMIQTSNVHIELLKHGDHFTYGKPSALVRGLITGNRTVDFTGEMRIINQTTGDYCNVHFKEGGMFSGSSDMVECHLHRAESSKVDRVLRGNWPTQVRYEKSTTQSDILWTALALPPNAGKYYSFSYFSMCLNELVEATAKSLPPTDTRFRPDQRAYEEGRLQDAEKIKHELEEAQRERKRERDANGEEWKTQWFEERDDPYSETGTSWQYKGGYWDSRANHSFAPSIKLW